MRQTGVAAAPEVCAGAAVPVLLLPLLAVLLSACASFPLEQAALGGDTREIQELLRRGADVNHAATISHETALIAAARAGKLEAARILLDAGADVNAEDYHGRTPLIYAAAAGRADMVKLLLARGASVLSSDSFGETPFMLAAHSGNSETLAVVRAARDQALAYSQTPDSSRPLAAPAPPAQDRLPGAAAPEPSSPVDSPSFAPLPEKPDDFAVVIGVESYGLFPNKALYAERDARSAGRYFRALGVPERHIMTLLGPQATRSLLQSRLERWLPDNVKPGSRVYVYFSGHGAPDPSSKKAYLVPFDGDPNDLTDTAYPVDRLYASLGKLKARQTLVFLDACFSGEGGRSVLAQGARPLMTVVSGAPSGRVKAMTAAGRGQITGDMPGQGHGLFTYYFLKGLDGDAQGAAGRVTMKSLYDYLKPKVADEARLKFRSQDPQLLPPGWSGGWILR